MKRIVTLLLGVVVLACGSDPVAPTPSTPSFTHQNSTKTIKISPDSLTLQLGQTGTLSCQALDNAGNVIAGRGCFWASLDPEVATLDKDNNSVKTLSVVVTSHSVGVARVRAGNGGHVDTVNVTVVDTVTPPPPPPPDTGSTFFSADAESGTMIPPWDMVENNVSGNPAPISSLSLFKSGSRSYRFEKSSSACLASIECKNQVLQFGVQHNMSGGSSNKFVTGWYSTWLYIDAGFTEPGWEMLLGWMTGGVNGQFVDPISHIGLEIKSGQLQVVYYLKNAAPESGPNYTPPSIPGYTLVGGEYMMSASSPAGIVPFPKNQWVHLSVYYKMARTNGQVQIWQNGVKIMDLTAPTLNTYDGFFYYNNTTADMILQFGLYSGVRTVTQRMYADDFKVTDTRVLP